MADPIDVHIGRRLRVLRLKRQLSQQALAHSVGISYQQIQKYESSVDRVSASRLYSLSKVLGISVTAFYDGLDDN